MLRSVWGLVGMVGVVVVSGCGSIGEPVSSTDAVTQTLTETVTASSTASSTTAGATTTAGTTTSPTDEPEIDYNAIRSVVVTVAENNNVGERLIQANRRGYAEIPTVRWTSRSENGDLRTYDCGVIVDVTGPGGADERQRSNHCTGVANMWPRISALGTYNVKVELTPPGGGDPFVTETTFELIGYGH